MLNSVVLLFLLLSKLCSNNVYCENFQNLEYKYQINPEYVSHEEAEKWCKQHSMQLVSIENVEKNNELLQFIDNKMGFWLWEPNPEMIFFKDGERRISFWTSGKYNGIMWTWAKTPLTYYYWIPGMTVKNQCLEAIVRVNGTELFWSDVDCKYLQPSICEKADNDKDTNVVTAAEKCYHISTEYLSQPEAVQFCQQLSMELISIPDKKKNNEINQVLRDSGRAVHCNKKEEHYAELYWSSGNRFADKTFRWLSGDPIEYSNWQKNNANTSSCLLLAPVAPMTVKWYNDKPCSVKKKFICETTNLDIEKSRYQKNNNGVSIIPPYLRKEYYLSDEVATYFKALQICKARGMQLLSIQDNDKSKAVYRELSTRDNKVPFWTSASRIYGTDIWLWHGGSVIKFLNWNSEETSEREKPNEKEPKEQEPTRNCIEIIKSNNEILYTQQLCEFKRNFICENAFPSVNMYCVR